ncbi:hypothetical protein [Streptomyces sp. NPDC001985]|uniref:hypothetical protein n=1 Tax=Streptomyces sp. NPDC001985 TaxID=3154406 RepID=UPI00332B94F6
MRIRTSMAAAGLVAAASLVLSGCAGDDSGGTDTSRADSSKGQEKESGKDEGAASDAPDAPEATAGKADPAALQGQWMGRTDGTTVTIGIKDKTVVLLTADGACNGEVADHGDQMLAMTCAGGKQKRTMGTVRSADAKKLVVDWGDGITDTLTKAKLDSLPTKLPKLDAVPAS